MPGEFLFSILKSRSQILLWYLNVPADRRSCKRNIFGVHGSNVPISNGGIAAPMMCTIQGIRQVNFITDDVFAAITLAFLY